MTNFDDNRISAVGHRQVWGGTEPFGLRHADRLQHVYVLGQTGTGKSTLLRNLLIDDIQSGQGCALLDPHGDLAEEILDYIPRSRSDDLVYFNPADLEYPIAYNLLAGAKPDEIHLLASSVVSAFKSIWSQSWGPRMELLLFAGVAALAECCHKTGNVSLLGIQRMLIDDHFRAWVLSHVSDVAVRSFWLSEYEQYDARFRSEIISPVQNKIGALLMSPVLRNTLGQVRKSFDFRFMMDNRRIFIANLAKGRIGQDKAALLGALLVSQIEQAAFSRAELPRRERHEFFLFIDEFQNYLTDSFAGIFSESRKYALGITVSNQHLGQLRLDVRDAIMGNCGTIIAFRVGESDAAILRREYGESYNAREFTDLENYEVLVKLLESGRYREPFRGKTQPPCGHFHGRRERLIARSREKYARPRRVVEDKIQRWMEGGAS
jgi:type IV secretory pathway TraG/TraD family ATPase VirD4